MRSAAAASDANLSVSRCGQSVRAQKRLTIHEAPNILTIHVLLCCSPCCCCVLTDRLQLKRFRMGFFGKINKAIAFPYEFSLRPYMSPSQLVRSAPC